ALLETTLRGGISARVGDDRELDPWNALAYFVDDAGAVLPHDGHSEQNDIGPPARRLLVRRGNACNLVGFVLIVQHELQHRPRNLVAVDDEHALVLDCSGTLDTDLHIRLAIKF